MPFWQCDQCRQVRVQARVNYAAEDSSALAALAQLTTFVRGAREDVLLKPWDATVDLPAGSPDLQQLLDGDSMELRDHAQLVFTAMEELGAVLSSRCVAHFRIGTVVLSAVCIDAILKTS